MLTRTESDRLAEREASLAAIARVRSMMGRPYRRDYPREPVKAALLRRAGVADELVGPVVVEVSDALNARRAAVR